MKTIVSKNWVKTRVQALKAQTPTKESKDELAYWQKVLIKMNKNKLQIIRL